MEKGSKDTNRSMKDTDVTFAMPLRPQLMGMRDHVESKRFTQAEPKACNLWDGYLWPTHSSVLQRFA